MRAPHNNRMKLTKRPRGATVCQTGGAACAFAHRAFRSLSGGGLKGTTQHFGDDPGGNSGRSGWSVNGRETRDG
jgi:hypothetical protein